VAELPLRGAARIQAQLHEYSDAAMLTSQLTGIAVDPDMAVSLNDPGRRRVAVYYVSATGEKPGQGSMTQAPLARLAG